MFNRPIELQQTRHAGENRKRAERINWKSKHYKLNRLEISRECNATRSLLKSSKKQKEK